MTTMTTAGHDIIKISGNDAKAFLQGQLTCNLETLTANQMQLAAHCNPQGRIISLFELFFNEQDYYLVMHPSLIPIALMALKKYAVFYKLVLTSCNLTTHQYHQKIQDGIPTLYPETSGKFLPHELNLQYTTAISFDKGCYTGQEIIARMHYRGKLKNHLYQAIVKTEQRPLPGSAILDAKHSDVATIVDSSFEKTNGQYIVLFIGDEASINQPLFTIAEPSEQLTHIHEAHSK